MVWHHSTSSSIAIGARNTVATRILPTWALVALALAAGAFGGAALENSLGARSWRFDWQRRAQRALHYNAARRDPRQWAADSAREAAWRRAEEGRQAPREVGRVQALTHCVVQFEMRDTLYRHMELFHADAWDRSQTGTIIARGYAFAPHGWQRGDTAQIVFPNVWCGDIMVGGWGAGMIGPPAPPLRLQVR